MNEKAKPRPWTRYIYPVLFTPAGAAVGYLIYRYIGCKSGTCAITSNPYTSMLYLAVVGLLIGILAMPQKEGANKGDERSNG